MSNSAQLIRAAATSLLPPRAFLKRDRGSALFITNAPRLCPGQNWAGIFARAGFIAREEGGLVRLWPDESRLLTHEDALPDPPDFLCGSFLRFRETSVDEGSLSLFALGLRVLDGDTDPGYEKMLRSRAAVCLRSGGGGGLYACALINHEIKEMRQ